MNFLAYSEAGVAVLSDPILWYQFLQSHHCHAMDLGSGPCYSNG